MIHKEGFCRWVGPYRIAGNLKEHFQRLQNCWIIIDDRYAAQAFLQHPLPESDMRRYAGIIARARATLEMSDRCCQGTLMQINLDRRQYSGSAKPCGYEKSMPQAADLKGSARRSVRSSCSP